MGCILEQTNNLAHSWVGSLLHGPNDDKSAQGAEPRGRTATRRWSPHFRRSQVWVVDAPVELSGDGFDLLQADGAKIAVVLAPVEALRQWVDDDLRYEALMRSLKDLSHPDTRPNLLRFRPKGPNSRDFPLQMLGILELQCRRSPRRRL